MTNKYIRTLEHIAVPHWDVFVLEIVSAFNTT
jgi:hypothetical protein